MTSRTAPTAGSATATCPTLFRSNRDSASGLACRARFEAGARLARRLRRVPSAAARDDVQNSWCLLAGRHGVNLAEPVRAVADHAVLRRRVGLADCVDELACRCQYGGQVCLP